MKKIYFITMSLFLVILTLNGVSALNYVPANDFSSTINDLLINTEMPISEVVKMCVKENCIVDGDEISNPNSQYLQKWTSVIIRSHYDPRVALIFKYETIRTADGLDTSEFNSIRTLLPYKFDENCEYELKYNEYSNQEYYEYPGCLAEPTTIDPMEYNWKESLKTDLNFLKDLGFILMFEEEVEEASSLAEVSKSIVKFEDTWVSLGIGCVAEKDDEGWHEECPTAGGTSLVSSFMLPLESFEIVKKNDVKETEFSHLIYWIVGIIIIVLITTILVLRYKKKQE